MIMNTYISILLLFIIHLWWDTKDELSLYNLNNKMFRRRLPLEPYSSQKGRIIFMFMRPFFIPLLLALILFSFGLYGYDVARSIIKYYRYEVSEIITTILSLISLVFLILIMKNIYSPWAKQYFNKKIIDPELSKKLKRLKRTKIYKLQVILFYGFLVIGFVLIILLSL